MREDNQDDDKEEWNTEDFKTLMWIGIAEFLVILLAFEVVKIL